MKIRRGFSDQTCTVCSTVNRVGFIKPKVSVTTHEKFNCSVCGTKWLATCTHNASDFENVTVVVTLFVPSGDQP